MWKRKRRRLGSKTEERKGGMKVHESGQYQKAVAPLHGFQGRKKLGGGGGKTEEARSTGGV